MDLSYLPLEPLQADAMAQDMPDCMGFLVFSGDTQAVLAHLKTLYKQSQTQTLYYIDDPAGNFLVSVAQAAQRLHKPLIVIEDKETPSPLTALDDHAAVSLISRGSGQSDYVKTLLNERAIESLSWLGFQKYYTNPDHLETCEKRGFETLRLGALRQNLKHAEPLLRQASYHLFDMRCVRMADCPNALDPNPNGLYAEELCTLARYAGLCSHFSAAQLFGFPSSPQPDMSKLLSQVLWHLTEGLSVAAKEDPSTQGKSFHRKAVQLDEDGKEIVFLLSVLSGRWWMEVPNSKCPTKPYIIPCDIDDYQAACKGEVPIKWIMYFQKYNNYL